MSPPPPRLNPLLTAADVTPSLHPRLSAASEVYSFAIVSWELVTCEVPWALNPDNGKMWTQPALIRAVVRGR